MAMKRLVVCCDGTWNSTDSGTNYTNVSRLAWAITATDTRGGGNIAQIVFYQSGVGSEGDVVGRIKSGAVGLGLAHNVRDAYSFICNNYSAGDEIFLFGFSRGAYTARSVAGLIGYAGLITKRDLDRFLELWNGYRLLKKPDYVDPRPNFANRAEGVDIRCIGVWDTVGSVGIPGNIDFLFTDYYAFHDTTLGERVQFAYHAMALDEHREDFQPTLWQQKPEGKDRGQKLKQVWFAGAHSDVGGGYPEHGLSDITLCWMASEVEPLLSIDFDYLKQRRDLTSKWSLGPLHDSAKGVVWAARKKIDRKPFGKEPEVSFESIHASVQERIDGGNAALPGKYVSGSLNGIDVAAKVGALSAREAAFRWSAQEVNPAKKPDAEKSFNIASKILGLIGAG